MTDTEHPSAADARSGPPDPEHDAAPQPTKPGGTQSVENPGGGIDTHTVQLALFDAPEKPLVRPVSLADQERAERVTFACYRAKCPPPCDDCKLAQHRAGGVGPMAHKARFKVQLAPDRVLLLCGEHKRLRRRALHNPSSSGEIR